MAPARITRSANSSLPRKKYSHVYAAHSESNTPPPDVSSDESGDDEDIPANPGRSGVGKSTARSTGKRKQRMKPATQKGHDVAPPAKRQRKRTTLKSRGHNLDLEESRFLWSTKHQTPLPDLPDSPPSLAAPSIADWQEFSEKVNSPQTKVQVEGIARGKESIPSSGASDGSAALAVLNAELAARAKQERGATKTSRGVRISTDRAFKEQSVEWLYLDNEGAFEEGEEEPAPSDPLLAQERLERQRLAQQALAQQQLAQDSPPPSKNGQAQKQAQEESRSDGQPLADEEVVQHISSEAQRFHDFEVWVARDLHVPDVSAARSTVVLEDDSHESEDEDNEEGPAAKEDAIETGETHAGDQAECMVRSDDDGEDFDVDFSNQQAPPSGFYDMEDDEGDDHPDRDEESLFVQDVPVDEAEQSEAGSVATKSHSTAPEAPQGKTERQDRGINDEEDERAGVCVDKETEEKAPDSIGRPIAPAGHRRPSDPPSSERRRALVYIQPVEDSFKATISSRHLETILQDMRTRTWTREGLGWQAELLSGYNVHLSTRDREDINRERRNAQKEALSSSGAKHPATRWYNAHRRELQSPKAREMLQIGYHLWRICRAAPTEAQVAYFTNGTGRGFEQALASCNNYVAYICERLPAAEGSKLGWARSMRESLSCRLVPLLVLVLKEAFLMASSRSMDERRGPDHVQLLPGQVEATEFQLQVLLTILGLLERLCSAVQGEFEVNPPNPRPKYWETRTKQRFGVMHNLYAFEADIRSAVKARKEAVNEPSRRARAAENDRRVRQRKDVTEQKSREEQARQLQLFQTSLQGSMVQRDDLSSSAPYVLSRPRRPSRKALSEEEKYAIDNKGWYWDEDDMLLSALKRVDQPNTRGLAELLTGRSREQVAARLMDLREKGRAHYEDKRPGMAIPRWCEGYGWR